MHNRRAADMDGGVDVVVPDALLLPVIEVAADVLRELEIIDVPSSLKPLHGFDRRGLLAGPGPRQLRRAMKIDEAFCERVVERFLARPEVGALLEAWTVETAAAAAADAAACGDFALHTASLWAGRPDGYEFGLGIAVVLDAQQRERQREEDEGKSWRHEKAALEEARRRAEAARIEAEAAATRAEADLQKERNARRSREEEANENATAAQRCVDALQTELDQARAEVEEHQNHATRASQRARTLEDDLRKVRADTNELRERAENAESRLGQRDDRALSDAATTARQLSVSLDALQRRIKDGAPPEGGRTETARPEFAPAREPAPTRRTSPNLPPGVVANSPMGVQAMLATPDVVLIVDGYNIAHRAWPHATAGDQRERLAIAATALSRRIGCDVVLVFDGDGSGSRPSMRRGGVQVLFSDSGEEADEVVVREVECRPKKIPVVVASSDAWVREHASEQGAAVVGAGALVRILRPER